jgi:glycerol-3-phosphate acyltransferase PlsY
MPFLLTAVLSYLLGSIPFGYLLVRMFHGQDIRQTGSGNIGATNVARKSPGLGIATLVLDALKGLAAVALTRHFAGEQQVALMALAALGAVVGHSFPVWLRFRGGKGVATGLGAFLWIAPKSIVVMVGIFAAVVALSRYVSLGSLAAAASLPFLAWWLDERHSPRVLLLLGLASALILLRHHQNVRRLLAGTESRLGAKKT